MPVFRLNDEIAFPSPEYAEDDGLLAIGGNLQPERLVLAYSHGIFPWPHEGYPLLWFSPSLRMVLFTDTLKISRRLRRTIRKKRFQIRLDTACPEVISSCASIVRKETNGTWITSEMLEAYTTLHEMGIVHSAESWMDGKLVGGLYGVSLGGAFIGESMFAKVSDASKVAFVTLVKQLQRWSINLIDAQVYTTHLSHFGAQEYPRNEYLKFLKKAMAQKSRFGKWSLDDDL